MLVRQVDQKLTVGRVLRQTPYLAFVIAVYLIVAVIDSAATASILMNPTLPSGGIWVFTLGDLFLLAGLFALFGEILKATRTSRVSVADHAMSLLAFIVCLIAFLLWPAASTSVFFLLLIMTLVDVLAGFTVSLSGARRDIDMGSSTM
jgi:hypothetical protein